MSENGKYINETTKEYIMALLEKSEEAYLMSLEIINKPTIKYRTEGFCFFICNAWELLLKAFIIRRENNINAINFKNNPNQTLGLLECIEKVLTSTTDYTKANLFIIREIRNKSTHNILPDYDFKLASVFQRCVSNFNNFFNKHFSEYMFNKQISAFVALSNLPNEKNSALSLNPVSLFQLKAIEEKISENNNEDLITQTIKLVVTKKTNEADIQYSLSDKADDKAHILHIPKDVNISHPYSASQAVAKIQETLIISLGINHGFNMNTFTNICNDKKIRENQHYYYAMDYGKGKVKKYSEKLLEYIVYIYSQDGETRARYRKKM